jgi:hypothetical protein
VVIGCGGRVAGSGTVVGIWIGDDGGVLCSVDGSRLETVDTVELEGDGGVDVGRADCH